MRKITLSFSLLFFLLSCQVSFAQFYPTQYRPPQQNWQYLNTPHFKFIYAQGNDSSAYAIGRLLENQYPQIQDLVGGELNNFPIILNNYNDLSNGFVTPINFRSEIELPPLKSKTMNPATGGWYHNVAPHELVHAMQFSNLGDINIPQFISLFSPDLARSFHGAIPAGILEGIAVYHETEGVTPKGGRGNYPFFTNRFNATFQSDQRWSMGQMVHLSSRSRPFSRHYIGGYQFTSWLHNNYGNNVTKEALDFYMDWPFLGYGVALRHATDQWPGQLYNRFEDYKQNSTTNSTFSSAEATKLNIPFNGRKVRRPLWIDNTTLLFHGSFYNARPGFYQYNIKNNQIDRITTTSTLNDYRYSLSDDRKSLVYSYYEADPLYDNTFKAELVRYNFDDKTNKQLTEGGRYFAPAFSGDRLFALQSDASSSKLISLKNSKAVSQNANQLVSFKNHEIKAVASNPENNLLAVVINKKGSQALWVASKDELQSSLNGQPDITFDGGSIFDPSWHPGGNKLLFSSDVSGTLQLYEYHLQQATITQLTSGGYNAFEGSYSPDGNRIAFVRQIENEQLPYILDKSEFLDNKINTEDWKPTTDNRKEGPHSVASDSILTQSKEWEKGDYSTGLSWLKPRTWVPVVEEVSNQDVYKWGASFHSTNTLSNHSYSGEVTLLEDRAWFDLTYRNKSFYPGFKARLFSEPSYSFATDQSSGETITLLREERGGAISVPLPITLNRNIFFTSLFIEPELRYSQIQFTGLSIDDFTTDFSNTSIGNVFGQFNFRLQQNIRDMQPNSGALIYGEVEHYLNREGFEVFDDTSSEPTGFQGGLFTYLSPLRRWNQSLRVGIKGVTQSGLVYNNQDIVSDAFSEPVSPTSNNLLSFSTRYTIPLIYADDGGFLLPFYLSNIYLVGFSNTVIDPTAQNWHQQSRSVFGIGLRTRFRISNLSFELGVGLGYEPTRNDVNFFMGDF